MCVQDYKSLCAPVTICATLVNIQIDRRTRTRTERQTHRQHFDQLTRLAQLSSWTEKRGIDDSIDWRVAYVGESRSLAWK